MPNCEHEFRPMWNLQVGGRVAICNKCNLTLDLDALVEENNRLRAELAHANELKGQYYGSMVDLRAELGQARAEPGRLPADRGEGGA